MATANPIPFDRAGAGGSTPPSVPPVPQRKKRANTLALLGRMVEADRRMIAKMSEQVGVRKTNVVHGNVDQSRNSHNTTHIAGHQVNLNLTLSGRPGELAELALLLRGDGPTGNSSLTKSLVSVSDSTPRLEESSVAASPAEVLPPPVEEQPIPPLVEERFTATLSCLSEYCAADDLSTPVVSLAIAKLKQAALKVMPANASDYTLFLMLGDDILGTGKGMSARSLVIKSGQLFPFKIDLFGGTIEEIKDSRLVDCRVVQSYGVWTRNEENPSHLHATPFDELSPEQADGTESFFERMVHGLNHFHSTKKQLDAAKFTLCYASPCVYRRARLGGLAGSSENVRIPAFHFESGMMKVTNTLPGTVSTENAARQVVRFGL